MKRFPFVFLMLFITLTTSCQTGTSPKKDNLDFEIVKNGLPVHWENFGNPDYVTALDSTVVEKGRYSASIEYSGDHPDFKAWAYPIPAIYEGKKITLSGYLKTENVIGGAGLWMPEPTPFVKFSKGSLTDPGLFTMTNPLSVGLKNDDYYKGKVVIIVNETTQSQAEYTTMAFRAAPNVTVIGSTTAGADGNVSSIYLPGAIRTMISGIGIFYPDGKGTQRVGIVPDVIVKPTINGIKNGKDELLDKAIEIIGKK